MKKYGRAAVLVAGLLSCGLVLKATPAFGRAWYDPKRRGFTERERRPRGQYQHEEQYIREKLRQLRIQQARMPEDIRAMAPIDVGRPGAGRPEIVSYLRRDRTRLVAGGWLWGNPAFGWEGDTPMGYMMELDPTDPKAIGVKIDEPIVEWWEASERSRGQRAEWFRARFGAAQQLQTMPQQQLLQQQQQQLVPQEGVAPAPGEGLRPEELGPPGAGGGLGIGGEMGPPGGDIAPTAPSGF